MEHNITLTLARAFSRRAAAMGYDVQMADASNDPKLCKTTFLGQREVCNFETSGSMRFFPDNLLVPERKQLNTLLLEMKRAHDLFADAKPLELEGVRDFRLISQFGSALLAAKLGNDDEVRFITWEYTYDHTGVTWGHYFEINYEGAKRDFAL